MTVPVFEDVKSAAGRIDGHVVRTPLIHSQPLSEMTGADVYLKPENLQLTGSFKFRGAFNALCKLFAEHRGMGVVASSSGNHGQGIAEAARILGMPATVIMPSDAPSSKIERTKRSGATVKLYDRMTEEREAIAQSVVDETGACFVHPFDNPDVIAGQGTVGLEIAEDLAILGRKADRVLVCTGGGGLTAGVNLAVANGNPQVRIHPCEPEGFDDYRRSLESGRIERNERPGGSVCDAILSPSPGKTGFAINKDTLAEGLVVTDAQAMAAVAYAFRELKLVLEPGGAVALAALLNSGRRFAGETLAVILSGGNIDLDCLAAALAA